MTVFFSFLHTEGWLFFLFPSKWQTRPVLHVAIMQGFLIPTESEHHTHQGLSKAH